MSHKRQRPHLTLVARGMEEGEAESLVACCPVRSEPYPAFEPPRISTGYGLDIFLPWLPKTRNAVFCLGSTFQWTVDRTIFKLSLFR